MAQGKNKVKAKLPENVKHKTFNKTKKTAFQKRKSAPAKQKLQDKQKIQQAITKSVNRKNEDEMRSRATSTQQNLSNAQKYVAKYHEKKASTSAEAMATEDK